ncbi:MAG: hypothetical protein KAT29_04720 [Anaerolineales bacterium]|nr:hypothetical protein [Anaerolineales bacterium]
MKKIATEVQRVRVEVFIGRSFVLGDLAGSAALELTTLDVERVSSPPHLVADIDHYYIWLKYQSRHTCQVLEFVQ